MPRTALSTLLTLTLGLTGGALGARLLPAEVSNMVLTEPAHAREVALATPVANDGIADLVDRVKGAVVNIDTVSHQRTASSRARDRFRYHFGDAMPEPERKGVGSGFIVKADGLIVTNHHVIKGADKLRVTLSDGRKFDGRVVGADPGTDLALVRIEAKGLPTLTFARPESLRVGQYVVAVGSPLGLSQTVTAGILSAINRDIDINARVGFLQTDAPINPGNSGGPLLNLRGEVVGVNTAVARGGQGIGFAIPVDMVETIVPQLEAKGRVERAWLGVGVTNLPEDRSQMFYPAPHGVLLGRVDTNGPAARAGLRQGDVVLSFDGHKLESAAQLIRLISKLPVGQEVSLKVNRQGQERSIKLKLDRMPETLQRTGR